MSRKDELYHYGVKGMKWGKRKAIREYLDAKKKGALDRSAKANADLKKKAIEKSRMEDYINYNWRDSARRSMMNRDKTRKRTDEIKNAKYVLDNSGHKVSTKTHPVTDSSGKISSDVWNRYNHQMADYKHRVNRNNSYTGKQEERRNLSRSKGSSLSGGRTSRSYMQDARENVDAIRDNIKNRQTDPDWSNTRWNAKQAVRNTAKAGKTAARSFIKKLRKKKK